MRAALRVGLLAIAAAAAGCQTPVGNYFVNRARDFGECWRAEAGLGFGLGGGVHAVGLAHLGLGFGMPVGPGCSFGWRYGEPLGGSGRLEPIGVEGWLLFMHAETRRVGWEDDVPDECHRCYGLLPAVFARVDPWGAARGAPKLSANRRRVGGPTPRDHTWLWESDPSPMRRRMRLHAFDAEVVAYCFTTRVAVGFSPGEFVDFLLGWFGADIAGDDRPFVPAADGR